MTDKRGEDGNTKIWISQEQKELFSWNKKHFFKVFEGQSFGEKIKNSGQKLYQAVFLHNQKVITKT